LKEGQERVTTVTDFAKPIAISFADFHKKSAAVNNQSCIAKL